MGLIEQINLGNASLNRSTVAITLNGSQPQFTGSLAVGRTFILTNAQTTTPCRLRLYGNVASRDDTDELLRPFNSQSISGSISLLADINLTDNALFNLTPPLFGANLDNPVQSTIYYTVDTGSNAPFSGTNTVSFTRFLLEDTTAALTPNVVTRETILITGSISAGSSVTGSVATPKTYVLLQVIPNTNDIRLRLYAAASYRDNINEINRAFSTEPTQSSGVIADIYIDNTITSSFTPMIVGRNMDAVVSSTTYYNLTNVSGTSPVTASLYLFSLED